MHENSINASLLDKPDLIEEEYEDLIDGPVWFEEFMTLAIKEDEDD